MRSAKYTDNQYRRLQNAKREEKKKRESQYGIASKQEIGARHKGKKKEGKTRYRLTGSKARIQTVDQCTVGI